MTASTTRTPSPWNQADRSAELHPDSQPKARTMITLPRTQEEQISELIGTTIEQLDITEDEFLAAERCYDDLGAYLAEAGVEVYVQGSFLLGTVVRPLLDAGEYDLDLVAR